MFEKLAPPTNAANGFAGGSVPLGFFKPCTGCRTKRCGEVMLPGRGVGRGNGDAFGPLAGRLTPFEGRLITTAPLEGTLREGTFSTFAGRTPGRFTVIRFGELLGLGAACRGGGDGARCGWRDAPPERVEPPPDF